MAEPIIKVKDLAKEYKIFHQTSYLALRDALASWLSNPVRIFKKKKRSSCQEKFWALKDISFEVKQGEVIGVIGRNGAGKTTLLKLLSRITYPTKGEIHLYGRVGSLLEVGTGFHPELTGRENIYFNGSVLGMRKREIDKKFDEIVEFSGVEKFLDVPVKRFSSGMQVRLAFSVAAHLDPEILLVDEVLSVGDFQFQKKCLGKMQDVASNEGRTVIFVSHNMGAVRRLCQRALLLKSGEITEDGTASFVVDKYLASVLKGSENKDFQDKIRSLPSDPDVKMHSINISQEGGSEVFVTGKDIRLEFDYEILQSMDRFFLNLQIWDNNGNYLSETFNNADEIDPVSPPGSYKAVAVIPGKFLLPVSYEIKVYWGIFRVRDIVDPISIALDVHSDGVTNMVYAARPFYGKIALPVKWETERRS